MTHPKRPDAGPAAGHSMPIGRGDDAPTAPETGDHGKPAGPPIDIRVLTGLAEDLGRGNFVDLLTLFETEAERRCDRIAAAVDRQDMAGIRHEAHALKGSAATLGATLVGEYARSLEDAARRGDGTRLRGDLLGLRDAVTQTRDALRKAVSELVPE